MKRLLFLPAIAILASCSTANQATKGTLILTSITVSADQTIIRGTIKLKGITPEVLRQKINDASQNIFSIDKIYILESDTSSNADFTFTSPLVR